MDGSLEIENKIFFIFFEGILFPLQAGGMGQDGLNLIQHVLSRRVVADLTKRAERGVIVFGVVRCRIVLCRIIIIVLRAIAFFFLFIIINILLFFVFFILE